MSSSAFKLASDPSLLGQLLRTGQVRKAGAAAPQQRPARTLSTGLGLLDAALCGGLLRGHLTEVVAAPSAGGTALLRAALGAATRRGELCALIDPGDAFDPGGALDDGLPDPARIELRRLLWIRPPTLQLALRAAEIALEARFALVALDLMDTLSDRAGPRPERTSGDRLQRLEQQILGAAPLQLSLEGGADRERVVRTDRDARDRSSPSRAGRGPQHAGAPWARLARRAEQHGGALLVLSRAPQVGAFAAAAVELGRRGGRWSGVVGTPGRLLVGADSSCAVARLKNGAQSPPHPLALHWNSA